MRLYTCQIACQYHNIHYCFYFNFSITSRTVKYENVIMYTRPNNRCNCARNGIFTICCFPETEEGLIKEGTWKTNDYHFLFKRIIFLKYVGRLCHVGWCIGIVNVTDEFLKLSIKQCDKNIITIVTYSLCVVFVCYQVKAALVVTT